MTEFIASNGVTIEHTNSGRTLFLTSPGDSWPNPEEHSLLLNADYEPALREFFLKERDDELGRWRWPENPDYVVYPSGEAVRVLREPAGTNWYPLYRGRTPLRPDVSIQHRVARAYFDAHPEPKSWHDAKPGEHWELTAEGATREYVAILARGKNGDYVRFFPIAEVNAVTLGIGATVITAGRRLWPEDSDVSGV